MRIDSRSPSPRGKGSQVIDDVKDNDSLFQDSFSSGDDKSDVLPTSHYVNGDCKEEPRILSSRDNKEYVDINLNSPQSNDGYNDSAEGSSHASIVSAGDIDNDASHPNTAIESLKLIANSVGPVFLVKTFLPLVLNKLGMNVEKTNAWEMSAIAAPTFIGVSTLSHIKYHVENRLASPSTISKLKKSAFNMVVAFLLVRFNFWATQVLSNEYGQNNTNLFDMVIGLLIGFGFNLAEIYMAYREAAAELGISENSRLLEQPIHHNVSYDSVS